MCAREKQMIIMIAGRRAVYWHVNKSSIDDTISLRIVQIKRIPPTFQSEFSDNKLNRN